MLKPVAQDHPIDFAARLGLGLARIPDKLSIETRFPDRIGFRVDFTDQIEIDEAVVKRGYERVCARGRDTAKGIIAAGGIDDQELTVGTEAFQATLESDQIIRLIGHETRHRQRTVQPLGACLPVFEIARGCPLPTVEIKHRHAASGGRQGDRRMHSGGRLSGAAFFIGEYDKMAIGQTVPSPNRFTRLIRGPCPLKKHRRHIEGITLVQLARELSAVREAVGALRAEGGSVALVPTMGALHDGHIRLVTRAREMADHVVASIFVNPAQFGEGEDFESYPRTEEDDRAKLEAAGCDLLWAPPPGEVYPDGFATAISVSGVTEGLCSGSRPYHFDGVATVVAKLFNQILPDYALFGEKDYQQLALIRRMARDLDFQIEIIGVPTVREEDGLALSSRNAYLTADERARAVALPNALSEAASAIGAGEMVSDALIAAKAKLFEAGFAPIDYVELRDAETLEPVDVLERPARLLAAARMGKTRLIDNIAVESAG